MDSKIIGSVISKNGTKYYVRYDYHDELLQVSIEKIGPWFVVRDFYSLDANAYKYAQEYVDSFIN